MGTTGNGLIFYAEAGKAAEDAIKSAALNVQAKTVAAPANSNLTAVSNGVSCCGAQKSRTEEVKENLTADAEVIGALTASFTMMDEEQGRKNQDSLLSAPGLNGSPKLY